MGKIKVFRIQIDNANGVCYPGQTVSGQVLLEIKEELKLREIKVYIYGGASVKWTERRRTGQNTTTITFMAQENYFSHKIVVLGKESGKKDDIVLKPGSYSFPLSYNLPQGLPSSYEADIGRVRYIMKASIDRPWAFDEHTKMPFTVMGLLDLNTHPELMNSAEASDEKVMCCMCCKSDPITGNITIHRQGHVPGEAIIFSAEVNNESKREMKNSKVRLMMQVTYFARGGTRTVNNCLQELKHGKISGSSTDVWRNETLIIPPVPPSGLPGCSIIDIQYLLVLAVELSGAGFSLNVPVEVIIGNVPFQQIAQQHGMTVQPNAPVVSYAESAFGRVSTKEDDDKNTTTTDYAPMYGYYKWEKQDALTNFKAR